MSTVALLFSCLCSASLLLVGAVLCALAQRLPALRWAAGVCWWWALWIRR